MYRVKNDVLYIIFTEHYMSGPYRVKNAYIYDLKGNALDCFSNVHKAEEVYLKPPKILDILLNKKKIQHE